MVLCVGRVMQDLCATSLLGLQHRDLLYQYQLVNCVQLVTTVRKVSWILFRAQRELLELLLVDEMRQFVVHVQRDTIVWEFPTWDCHAHQESIVHLSQGYHTIVQMEPITQSQWPPTQLHVFHVLLDTLAQMRLKQSILTIAQSDIIVQPNPSNQLSVQVERLEIPREQSMLLVVLHVLLVIIAQMAPRIR